MAVSYKVLGQSNPVAVTTTTLYTVPSDTQAIVSTLTICNTGVTTSGYRLSVCPNGVGVSTESYIVYDATVSNNDTIFLTLGMSFDSADVVRVYADESTVSFNLFGSEITWNDLWL